MANYTGTSITPSMVEFYIKTINDGHYYSRYYSDETAYIVNRLEGAYDGYFDAIIITENVTISALLYSTNGTSTVCWSNVNTAKPNWVYIINVKGTTGIQKYTYALYDYGSGVDQFMKLTINVILKKTEG